MAGYKSLQVADAINRIKQQIEPTITQGTIFTNTIAPDATSYAPLYTEQRTQLRTPDKDIFDYTQDVGVALAKGVVAVPQAAAGLVDIADAGLQSIQNIGTDRDVQGGRFTKALENLGVGFKETQDIMGGWYSDATQQQLQGLAQLPGMSTQKSFGENLDSLGQTAGYVLDNPSLALNTIIESLPSIGAGGAIGRGVSALGAQGAKIAGAVGEGAIMAGQSQANMDRNAEGYTTGSQALGALGIGVLGGAIGQLGNRFASSKGAGDIDNLSADVANQTTNKGFKSLGIGTVTEAAEEAAQSAVENVISNISSGKDAIEGLNQDLVLGTLAGAGMGGAVNARSSIASAALDALTNVAQKQLERAKAKAPETSDTPTNEFADPTSTKYNPAAAIVREGARLTADATPETVSEVQTSMADVLAKSEEHLANLTELKTMIEQAPVWETNLANAQATIANTDPADVDRIAQIQGAIDNVILPRIEQIKQAQQNVSLEDLNSAIETATPLVEEARTMHERFAPSFSSTSETDAPVDTKIFGAPTSYSLEELNTAIADTSVPESSKVALRALSEAVVAQNAVKTIDEVNRQVVGKSLDPNYKSTPQYLEQFGSAIKRGSTTAQNNLLNQINAFESSHVAKAALVQQGLDMAINQGLRSQIVRTESGNWEFNQGPFLKGDEAKANGAVTIHTTPRGIAAMEKTNEYMQAEAKAVTATRTAMEAMLNANTNTSTPSAEVTQVSPEATQDNTQVREVPTQQGAVESDPMQDALDSYNQEARDNYDFQPERRIDDPRNNETRSSTTATAPRETNAQTEVQPTSGTRAGTVNTKLPESSTQDYELVFDENGVGRNVPKTKAKVEPERVASRSVSEDVATEAKANTSEAKSIQAPREAAKSDTVVDVQVSTDVANQVTQEESTNEVVTHEVKKEAEPQDINTSEAPDKNPKRTAERAKEPNKRNLIIDGFNKRETVLNKNENFSTRFFTRDGVAPVIEKITKTVPTEKQVQAVKDFAKFDKYMSPRLDGLIKERKGVTTKGNDYADFRHQDYNQFLLEDGSLPENVKTAIAVAMYAWVAENGSKTLNTEKDVAGLLLMNDVETVSNNVFQKLTAIGDHQSVVTGSLGQKALEALGLKVVSDVDPARKQKLEQALGTLAAVALTQNGYLDRTTMSAQEFEALQAEAAMGNEKATISNDAFNDGKTLSFLVPKSGAKVDQIIKSAAETKGIVHSMFGVQRDIKLPSLEAVTTTPNSFNRMGSELPSYTKEMLEAAQKNAYKMSVPAMVFMDNVKQEDLRELFGYIKPNADGESFTGMHKKFWESQLASNQAVERAIAIIKEQRANLETPDQEFFFEHTSWTNTRSGYDAAFNLQANKMHRAVAGMADHVVEVGVEAPIKNGETTVFGEFLMAVAMTAEEIDIGLKTVDKVSAETYLTRFQEYLAQDYVQDAIESMASIIEGQGNKADMDNVKALTKEFGMGAMSVRGIQALAQMHIAERGGQRTFTSDIGFESDGVTNGPIITNVALATAYADMLEAGGIFIDKNKTNVPTNKEQGNKDIYELLGEVMKQRWATNYKEAKQPVQKAMDALSTIYPAFGKRNGAKPIVTTSNYGAGNASIIRANGREVINSFYKSLEKAGNEGNDALANDLINAANVAIDYGNFIGKTNIPRAIAQGSPLEFLLTTAQEGALLEASNNLHGKAIKTSLETSMAEFQGVRDTLTKQAVAGFSLYESIRNHAINEALKDTNNVLVDGAGNRQEGLTSDQMKKVLKSIERYMPSVVSGMGNMSDNKKKSSIPLMKQETVWDGSKMSEQQFNFNGSWTSNQGKGFTVRSAIKRDAVADPGVSGLALIIQSIDAMIAHTTIGKMATQNYHDANASAVGQGKAMARIQNEAFVDGLLNTHVNREFVRALLNPLTAVLDKTGFANDNATTFGDAAVEADLSQSLINAYVRDTAKLRGMLKWSNVNQYGTQGGHYVMTNAKRKEILSMIDTLKTDLAKDLAVAKRIEALATKEEPTTIEDMLRANGTMTGADLVPMLQAELKGLQSKEGNVGKFSQFYDAVLDLITARMPASLEVNYFSEVSAPPNVSGLEEAITNENPAWFTTGKDGNPQINILKSDDPIKAGVLVHELVHAITVDSIAQVRNDPTAHAKAKKSLDKIDALYEFIKAEVKADPNATKLMIYATKNVEEFIATGFSYPEFVNYLDSKLVSKVARGKSRIVTALRSFVENILGVLESFTGRKYSAKDATALEALILDSTEFLGRTTPASVGTQSTIFGAPQQARDNVAGYTSKQVFDTLDSNLDTAFKAHLSALMTNVSDSIYAGLNSTLIDNADGSWSVEKAWDEYIKQGKTVTTQSATTAGFRMTEQESFAVESLYAALSHGLKNKSMTQVYAEMDKSFKAAKTKLKPQSFYEGDWNTATSADKQDAQDMYDFIFKYGQGNPEPLARFVSMALGSQEFNNLLGFTVKNTTDSNTGLFEKLVNNTNNVVDMVGGLLTNSSSAQLVSNKLGLLAKELARIDAKNREFAVSKLETHLETLADHTDKVSDKMRNKLVELANQDGIANSRYTAVRLASNVTRLSAKGDLWATLDVIKDGITLENSNQKLGFVGELLNEASNDDATNNTVGKMLRYTKLNNQMKENLRSTTSKNVLSTFEENGAYLDLEDKSALTSMMRADVQSLSSTYSTADIVKLYTDKNFLSAETANLETQIGDQVMINRAKDLAWYMVSGKSSNGLAKNATLIVSGFNQDIKANDPRIDLVDRIASLFAVEYTSTKDKNKLSAVMKREMKNKVNGVDTLIKFHAELAKTAKETLFVDNITSVAKGYVPEITNPNKDIRIAGSDIEAKLLKDQYYTEVKSLGRDPKDPRTLVNRLFITEEANIQRLVSGAIEVVSTNRKGSQVYMENKERAGVIKRVSTGFNTTASYDPRKNKDIAMVPNYNTQGKVIGFSYEMSGKNRDVLLERNNDFSDLMGAYAATNFNKVTVPEQNNRVVDAALQDYKDNFKSNPRAYVTVGPNSTDYGLREVWTMLPESTRKHVISTWGSDGMQVRNDVLLAMFGYRKYSLNQSFDKLEESKNMFEKLYTSIMAELFGNKAKIKGVRAERAWQESIALMKDIIVIRNVKTMIANTMSNAMLLSAHGVPPSDIIKDSIMSIRAGLQYRKDMANLLAAQQKQRAGVGDFNKLEQEILGLQDSLSRNPLASFIEEGMMPTIVEDVDPDTNHYSYKSKLQKKVDEYTSEVPQSVKTVAKWAFVSPDTPLYKLLNNATQFSDFSSKYVMYKYYTQKAKEKLSHDDALKIASDNFINYDVPTSRGLQYLNDMGVVMFTKYNIRIQKALFQLLKKRPAAAMAQAMFINSFTNLEAVIDPLVWFNMGNPLRTGALGLPSALDEPLPIKMMAGMF